VGGFLQPVVALSFIDSGKVIKVYMEDDNSLLAAMRLAQSKWGGVKLNGTDEYKRGCVEIAARNSICVANPELQVIKDKITTLSEPASLMAAARIFARDKVSEPVAIVTSAREGKEYGGALLGVFEYHGHFYAAQYIYENHLILHSADRGDVLALEAMAGQNVQLASGDGRVQTLASPRDCSEAQDRRRGWSR